MADNAFLRATLDLRIAGYDENTEPEVLVRRVLGAIRIPSQDMIGAGRMALDGGVPHDIDEVLAIWQAMVGECLK